MHCNANSYTKEYLSVTSCVLNPGRIDTRPTIRTMPFIKSATAYNATERYVLVPFGKMLRVCRDVRV